MPAKSKKQQRFFGLLKSIRDGDTSSKKVDNYKDLKERAKSMTMKQIDDFAGTKHKDLPEKKKKKRHNKKKKKSSLFDSRGVRVAHIKSIFAKLK